MFKRFLAVLVVSLMSFAGSAMADNGTPDEAKAMAEKAVAFLKANGQEAAFKAFDAGTDGFKDRDLYVFVNNYEGVALSHGANAKLIGKNLMALKDVNGVELVVEMVKRAKNDGKGWVEYSWTNPETKKIAPKTTYVIALPDYFIGVGAYK